MISSVKKTFSESAKLFELAFFPSFCKICKTLLASPQERVLCESCLDRIKPHRSSFCLCCGRFFEGVGEPHLCSSCLEKPPSFSVHRSCGRYRGELKDAILLFKYRRYKTLGSNLARFVFESLKKEEEVWWGTDIIVPVPLHRRRKWERGFNQTEVLAKELSRLTEFPLEADVLKKVRNIPPQTSLEPDERAKNVADAYLAANEERIQGKIILLVDDVFTTGSTLRECASVLKRAGAKEVRAITLAQA